MSRIRVIAKQLGDRHFQINLSNRIAIVTQSLLRAGKGGRMARVKAAYFGFSTHDEAMQFANQIRGRFPKVRLQVRKSERLTTAFEVKVSHENAERLAWEIVQRSETTGQRIERHLRVVATRPSLAPDAPVRKSYHGRTVVMTGTGQAIGID